MFSEALEGFLFVFPKVVNSGLKFLKKRFPLLFLHVGEVECLTFLASSSNDAMTWEIAEHVSIICVWYVLKY